MAKVTVDAIRRLGARSLHIHEDDEACWSAINRKQGRLLDRASAPEWADLEADDVYVHF